MTPQQILENSHESRPILHLYIRKYSVFHSISLVDFLYLSTVKQCCLISSLPKIAHTKTILMLINMGCIYLEKHIKVLSSFLPVFLQNGRLCKYLDRKDIFLITLSESHRPLLCDSDIIMLQEHKCRETMSIELIGTEGLSSFFLCILNPLD